MLPGRLIYYFADAAIRVALDPKREGEDIASIKPEPICTSSYITSKSNPFHFFSSPDD